MQNNHKLRTGALLCFILAETASARPQPIKAIDSVRLVGNVDVQSGEDAYASGKRLLAADDAFGALAAFQRTLAASPNSVDALNGIGVSYDRLGRGDLARTAYAAGLELDPASPRLLNNLGYSLFLCNDWAAAIAPLRAAAASADPEAAAAAQATLTRMADRVRPALPQAIAVLPQPAARIEQTNDGEQRLVIGPVERANATALSANAPAMSAEAELAAVAPVWTGRDDAALLDRVHSEQHAEQLALASLEASRDRAAAAPAPDPALTDEPLTVLPPSPKLASPDRAEAAAVVRPVTALVLGGTRADAALARRRAAAESKREVALTGGDPAQQLATFESDDDELNAFAARVRSDGQRAAARAGTDLAGIAARFRA